MALQRHFKGVGCAHRWPDDKGGRDWKNKAETGLNSFRPHCGGRNMYSSMAYPTLDPKDLAFLQKFYNDACAEHGFAVNSLAAEDLAARIMLSYQKGARTESDLTQRVNR
jgi:hypothetical protein